MLEVYCTAPQLSASVVVVAFFVWKINCCGATLTSLCEFVTPHEHDV